MGDVVKIGARDLSDVLNDATINILDIKSIAWAASKLWPQEFETSENNQQLCDCLGVFLKVINDHAAKLESAISEAEGYAVKSRASL